MNRMIDVVVLLGRNCMSQGDTGTVNVGPASTPAMLVFAILGRVDQDCSVRPVS